MHEQGGGKMSKMKIREGKTFLEFTDDYGWKTRINLNRNPLDMEIIQSNYKENRYVWLDKEIMKILLKKLKSSDKGVDNNGK